MIKCAILIAVASAALSVESGAQVIDKAFVLTVPVRLASMDAAAQTSITCVVRTGTTVVNGSNSAVIVLDASGNFSGNVVVEVANSSGDPALANAYECRLGVTKIGDIGATRDYTASPCTDLGSPTAVNTWCRSRTGTVFVGTVSGTIP